jgi:hypothetical protein
MSKTIEELYVEWRKALTRREQLCSVYEAAERAAKEAFDAWLEASKAHDMLFDAIYEARRDATKKPVGYA